MTACPKDAPRIDSKQHRKFVSKHRCIICTQGVLVYEGYTVSQCAHNRIGFLMKGKRPCDSKTTPLCPAHHQLSNDCQHNTNEAKWWEAHEIDPFEIGRKIAGKSPDERIRNTENVKADLEKNNG